jgi:hypothetical protein
MARIQILGTKSNATVFKEAFGTISKLNYLSTTLSIINGVRDEIKRKRCSRNSCFYSVQTKTVVIPFIFLKLKIRRDPRKVTLSLLPSHRYEM